MVKRPLYEFHLKNKAEFKTYGDWEMVSKYHEFEKEYWAIRDDIALMDVSGVTKVRIAGEGATDYLDYICTGNILSLSEGKSIYSSICGDNGMIVALVHVLKDADDYLLFTDPEKRRALLDWLNGHRQDRVEIKDISEEFSYISINGPKAIEIPKIVISEDILGLPYLGFEHYKIDDIDCILYRCGLSGEYEYKFLLPPDKTLRVWEKIIEVGKDFNLLCCGLDSLEIPMLEMRSVNQQKDLLPDTTLLRAGLHWMVNLRKEQFIGKDAILKEKQAKPIEKLTMFTSESERIQRNNKLYIEEENVGFVIHSGYSPKLKRTIGCAYIKREYAYSGIDFEIEVQPNIREILHTASTPLFLTKTVTGIREEEKK